MQVIYIIGGMGSGKSTVVERFKSLGAATIDLDAYGHEVLRQAETKEALALAFGDDVLDAHGQVNRTILAARAFKNKDATDKLNSITASRIMKLLRERLTRCESDLVCIEVSAYDGPDGYFSEQVDHVIAVVAPKEIRITRATSKGFDVEDVKKRISQQPSDDQRKEWADFIIINDGDRDHLDQQIQEIWTELKSSR